MKTPEDKMFEDKMFLEMLDGEVEAEKAILKTPQGAMENLIDTMRQLTFTTLAARMRDDILAWWNNAKPWYTEEPVFVTIAKQLNEMKRK